MDKVISSNITRSFNKTNDELYELLKVVPAKPIPISNSVKLSTCDFQARNDKQYIPKKIYKQKVKTVRDIRNLFEKEVWSELPAELEKQQNYILRKIKGSSLREDKTKSIARNMLNSEKPLTKSSWQMLMNINPEGHTHSMQYVLWNGRYIRINGSKGGKTKFICKYDLGKSIKKLRNSSQTKKYALYKKKGLLQNSLSVDFKPGPLACKKYLDNSYQKYHVGQIDVIDLPKPGLEVQPSYGSALDPTISNFVNKLRDENGTISHKWAEFSVSVLGTAKGSTVNLTDPVNTVTFDLSYNNNKKKLLMRRDLENKSSTKHTEECKISECCTKNNLDVLPEVQVIMKKMLDAVDIHVNQDSMCKPDDEIREDCQANQPQNNYKDKNKRRYCELDRLDVTVIRLNENESEMGGLNACNNSYCSLGCVCNSLKSSVMLKGHCGHIDCMFECKCDFSNYAMPDALGSDSELLPGIISLNNELSCSLAKEEQKFHQTVIVSGDKSILLKSKKRNCKSSKKYEDFYRNLECLKPKSKVQPVLTIIEPKLNCENIEPWCMVHNLYKCFCKGRFTETTLNEIISNDVSNKKSSDYVKDVPNDSEEKPDTEKRKENYLQKTFQNRKKGEKSGIDHSLIIYEIDSDDETHSCARINAYEGRKYSDHYYLFANKKIQEMEVNDVTLRKKLNYLVSNSFDSADNNVPIEEVVINDKEKNEKELQNEENLKPSASESSRHGANYSTPKKPNITMVNESSSERSISNKPKLVAWLESSYQEYKRRLDMGIVKSTLEPPKKGKVVLHQWDFILNRYSERKNLFLVSKQVPYRIFMAVTANNPLFENCINIDDIRFADLYKYPVTVKNLLTNTNNMKDYFCILYGYNHCWEFIGTVTKVSDQKGDLDDEVPKMNEGQNITTKSPNLLVDLDAGASLTISNAFQQMSPTSESTSKQSKWFIMTVENDFSEIQFYNRGFFVKYKSIIKAINVARMSGKTVRLSSQKCADKSDGTQFGIYAIPNANEYCVFVGPYEINEPLGVETVKSFFSTSASRKKTRGVWITTDKVDDMKVIDNPLSFIPSQKLEYNDLITMEQNSSSLPKDTTLGLPFQPEQKTPEKDENKANKEVVKLVKPIKISKSNGFYHLGSSSLLKSVSVIKSPTQPLGLAIKPNTLIVKSPACKAISSESNSIATPLILSDAENVSLPNSSNKRIPNRPVAEVAPQIKIASVYSQFDHEKEIQRKRKEGGMFILKPEEINQRLIIDGNKSPKACSSRSMQEENEISMDIEKLIVANNTLAVENVGPSNSEQESINENAMDIEDFLDKSTICADPENETFVISDDEETVPIITEEVKEVFIECTNIENLGAIRGEAHSTKGIRFQFPGFLMSPYYELAEVYNKINQVLSRKIYIHKNLSLEWHMVDSINKLKSRKLLSRESFGPHVTLTPQGIKMKNSRKNIGNIKTYLNKNKKLPERSNSGMQAENEEDTSKNEPSQNSENESLMLEEENDGIFSESVTADIKKSINEASNAEREKYTNVLKNIEKMSSEDC